VVELQKDEMRRKIQEGWDALQRGEKIDGEKFFADLEAKESLRREKAAKSA